MKPYLIILFSFTLFFACSKQNTPKVSESKPEWVIEETKMIDIILDLRLVDASQFIFSDKPPRDKAKDWDFVMKKHQVVDTIFINSHDYYAGHPKVLEGMYEKVINQLSEMQSDNFNDN